MGDIIQVYATGEGQTTPAGVDGKIAPLTLPLPAPNLTAAVLIGGLPARIQYIGAAPGLVAGALQVNVEIPAGVGSGDQPIFLTVGTNTSQSGLTVAVK